MVPSPRRLPHSISTTAQRSALLSRFCAAFGETAIAGLIADREFIGRAWMTSLAERDIPFILRIKDTFHVRLADGRQCQVRSLFRKVGVGGRRYIPENCRLGSRDTLLQGSHGWHPGPDRGSRAALRLTRDARLALQAEPGPTPPHPGAEAQGHELA